MDESGGGKVDFGQHACVPFRGLDINVPEVPRMVHFRVEGNEILIGDEALLLGPLVLNDAARHVGGVLELAEGVPELEADDPFAIRERERERRKIQDNNGCREFFCSGRERRA